MRKSVGRQLARVHVPKLGVRAFSRRPIVSWILEWHKCFQIAVAVGSERSDSASVCSAGWMRPLGAGKAIAPASRDQL